MVVFSKEWFKKNQKIILWFSNTPIIKIWFRWILCIREFDLSLKKRITEITPNSFSFGDRIVGKDKLGNDLIERTTNFRTDSKFARRLYFSLKPFWWVLHFFDWVFIDRFCRKFSFGFSTLTKYPEAGTTADWSVRRLSVDETWAVIVVGNGTNTTTNVLQAACTASSTTDQFLELLRGICNFDISDLGSDALISAATLSLWGNSNRTGLGSGWAVGIVESASASDSVLANGDFQTMSKTDFATRISQASWTVGAYNDFTLNSTALTYLDGKKTGIAKLGTMIDWDIDASFGGTWASTADSGCAIEASDYPGTTRDPKLVITYIFAKTLSESIALAETTIKLPAKVLSESFSLVGTLLKRAGKTLSDTFSLSEVFEKTKIITRTLTDTVAMADTIKKLTNKVLSDTFSLVESVVKCLDKIISDTFSMVQSITRRMVKIFSESFSMTETLKRYKNNLLIIWGKITKNTASWTKPNKNTSIWQKENKSE
jgi:hypothetical protein